MKSLPSFLILLTQIILPKLSEAQIPNNPCPNIFQYQYYNGYYFGELYIPYDGKGILHLGVNASFPGYQNLKLTLNRVSPEVNLLKPGIIVYRLMFPNVGYLPTITRIVFNDDVICYGPPPYGQYTNFWAVINSELEGINYFHYLNNGNDNNDNFGTDFQNNFENNNHNKPTNDRFPNGNQNNNFEDRPGFPTSRPDRFTTSRPDPFTTNRPDPFTTNRPDPFTTNRPYPLTTRRPDPFPTSRPDRFTTAKPGFPTRLPSTTRMPTRKPTTNNFHTSKPITTKRPTGISPTSDESCGIANPKLQAILNNQPLKDNEFPWLVAVFKNVKGSYEFYCTGNLISKQHVLTTGHCVRFFQAITFPKEDMLVVLGKSDLNNWAISGATLRTVISVEVHPEYRQYTAHGDVAMLTLDKPVAISDTIRPICLLSFPDKPISSYQSSAGVVAGWGKDEIDKKNNPEAKKVIMPITSQSSCIKPELGIFSNMTSDITFCAVPAGSSKGPCNADRGSALMIKQNQRYYLKGILSVEAETSPRYSGEKECDLPSHVLFSDIGALGDWIQREKNGFTARGGFTDDDDKVYFPS